MCIPLNKYIYSTLTGHYLRLNMTSLSLLPLNDESPSFEISSSIRPPKSSTFYGQEAHKLNHQSIVSLAIADRNR